MRQAPQGPVGFGVLWLVGLKSYCLPQASIHRYLACYLGCRV